MQFKISAAPISEGAAQQHQEQMQAMPLRSHGSI